jgi:hypothetical protein
LTQGSRASTLAVGTEARVDENTGFTWAGGHLGDYAEHHVQVAELIDWGALAAAEMAPEEREAQRALWLDHARDEYRALGQFSDLLADLFQCSAPVDVIACASRLIRDEVRHVDLCLRVVRALGGAEGDVKDLQWPRQRTDQPAIDRVARAMLCNLYIAETAALHIISTARKRESNAELRAVMQAILGDESFHSRFGWHWMAQNWEHIPQRARDYATEALPQTFARLHDHMPRFLAEAVEVSIRETMIPHLAMLGIDGQAAWDRRHVSG